MFHLNEKGDVNPCRATVQVCPLGEANHFAEEVEAYREFAERMKSAFPLTGIKKAMEGPGGRPRRDPSTLEHETAVFLRTHQREREWVEGLGSEVTVASPYSEEETVTKEAYLRAWDTLAEAYSAADTSEEKLIEVVGQVYPVLATVAGFSRSDGTKIVYDPRKPSKDHERQQKVNSSVKEFLRAGVYDHPAAGEKFTHFILDGGLQTSDSYGEWLAGHAFSHGHPSREALVAKAQGGDFLRHWSETNLDRLRQESMTSPLARHALAVKDPHGPHRKAAFDLLMGTPWEEFTPYQRWRVLRDTDKYLASQESKQFFLASLVDWTNTYGNEEERADVLREATRQGYVANTRELNRVEQAEPGKKRRRLFGF